MTRYKQEIAYELSGIKAKIVSNRKSAQTTGKAATAKIADACLPSLLATEAALTSELATAPERPERCGYVSHSSKFNYATTWPDAIEGDGLDIPAFLRRSK